MAKRMKTHNKVLVVSLGVALVGALIASIGTHIAEVIGIGMIVTGTIVAGIIAFLWYGYF